ncbi:hypothetical protein BCR34DRAFT_592884 [Clohesyomyces aquaticus]|uniref:Uncharacterized protein n=1 Tax=Clohesyomyces aquaticus TaxID=1231657 RepID=A0A1Y1YN96_9PLEO|nr:hypothetical protein BCR34DRAFT_592884 [Clohesyomyces aquaticus]
MLYETTFKPLFVAMGLIDFINNEHWKGGVGAKKQELRRPLRACIELRHGSGGMSVWALNASDLYLHNMIGKVCEAIADLLQDYPKLGTIDVEYDLEEMTFYELSVLSSKIAKATSAATIEFGNSHPLPDEESKYVTGDDNEDADPCDIDEREEAWAVEDAVLTKAKKINYQNDRARNDRRNKSQALQARREGKKIAELKAIFSSTLPDAVKPPNKEASAVAQQGADGKTLSVETQEKQGADEKTLSEQVQGGDSEDYEASG